MKRRLAFLAVAGLLACGGAHAQNARRRAPRFGRAWWVKVSEREGEGFLSGYSDCTCSFKGPGSLGAATPVSLLAPKITAYYARHRASPETVIEVAAEINRSAPPQKAMPNDEVDTRRHGYYDGLWWLGALGGEEVGYVEGYMVCLGRAPTRRHAERLARAITAWYAHHPSREDRAIADVLMQMSRERQSKAGQARKPR